ncbi:alpha/beta hydrolase [Allosphingosinicella flava]|nr:alpha/beta hydrolase [Sphingosinicella flava]
MRACLLACLACVPLAGCSGIGAFDALVAKDDGAAVAARNAHYMPGPRGGIDLYRPAVAPAAPLPVIVFFYGGSWNSGSKADYSFAGHALAAQGFLVAIPDYRLVPEVRFPGFLEDGAAAVRWVRTNAPRYGGDPDRIVLAGHSAGAYNATMLSVDPQWLGPDRAAVKGFAGIAGPYDFLPLDTRVTKETFGQAPDLEATQPVRFASADDPPALLMAAQKDDLVFASNSVAMAMALSQAGVAVETRVYPGVGHVGIMAAMSTLFRGRAPVVADLADFAHKAAGAKPKSSSMR